MLTPSDVGGYVLSVHCACSQYSGVCWRCFRQWTCFLAGVDTSGYRWFCSLCTLCMFTIQQCFRQWTSFLAGVNTIRCRWLCSVCACSRYSGVCWRCFRQWTCFLAGVNTSEYRWFCSLWKLCMFTIQRCFRQWTSFLAGVNTIRCRWFCSLCTLHVHNTAVFQTVDQLSSRC